MSFFITAALVFLIGEMIAYPIFDLIRVRYSKIKRGRGISTPIMKGILERLVVYTGLLAGFPQILIVFGAIKIATRLDEDAKKKVSNDYFLIGNFVSLMLVLSYVIIFRELTL